MTGPLDTLSVAGIRHARAVIAAPRSWPAEEQRRAADYILRYDPDPEQIRRAEALRAGGFFHAAMKEGLHARRKEDVTTISEPQLPSRKGA